MEDLSQRNMGTQSIDDPKSGEKVEEEKEKQQEDTAKGDLQQEISGKLQTIATTK